MITGCFFHCQVSTGGPNPVPKWNTQLHEPGSKLLVLGMVIQPLIGNPYNGYINPYYWVDDDPLLYGNIESLDPSTHANGDYRSLVNFC